jgi:hypothetical protein
LPFASCVVGSVVILLDRESEEAAAEDGLGRAWPSPSVRRQGWFLLDRGITRFSSYKPSSLRT